MQRYRSDYCPPTYRPLTVELGLDLDADKTRARSKVRYQRQASSSTNNPARLYDPRLPTDSLPLARYATALFLDGHGLELCSIAIDDRSLKSDEYQLTASGLWIFEPPSDFVLALENTLVPAANTDLSGLYVSHNTLLTQCEAEGFRRIMYFLDRPDVSAIYTVMLRADRARYPVLLSNGELIESGELDKGRHFAKWHDPFPKPSYLFAAVAGPFAVHQSTVQRADGTSACLQIYADSKHLAQTHFALDSLVRAIKFDEFYFGLPLDLNRFMIVVANDFNMGAMENKGLNIFNSRFVLCSPETATDSDYEQVESVVGHEYFHNWTGNRVTCRDWFQLTLKEGLTVFRDQEFTRYLLGAAAVLKRIDDVRLLRQLQFAEDSGPMAHPIRPEAYAEINNFYTVTVYEKGAEVVRMLHTLLGDKLFKQGLQTYLARHDGSGATCDDFVAAMAHVSGRDFSQFMRWYQQQGTPRLFAATRYDAPQQRFYLTVKQQPAPQQTHLPLHIPIACGLLDQSGRDVLLGGTQIIELTQSEQTFVFEAITVAPTLSFLRDFSAPVIVQLDMSAQEKLLLARFDSDGFNRWQANLEIAQEAILQAYLGHRTGQPVTTIFDPAWLELQRHFLDATDLDDRVRCNLLGLPTFDELAEVVMRTQVLEPLILNAVLQQAQIEWAQALATELQRWWQSYGCAPQSNDFDLQARGYRQLRSLILNALCNSDWCLEGQEWAYQMYQSATNMTDRSNALGIMLNHKNPYAAIAVDDFYQKYHHQALIVDKWFALQARSPHCDLAGLTKLLAHPDFHFKNPNRVRSVLGSFYLYNAAALHRAGNEAYQLWDQQILLLDQRNSQLAARLARAFDQWSRFDNPYRAGMRSQLQRLCAQRLSPEVNEIIAAALDHS